MSASLIIDPSGRVTRRLHQEPCFTPLCPTIVQENEPLPLPSNTKNHPSQSSPRTSNNDRPWHKKITRSNSQDTCSTFDSLGSHSAGSVLDNKKYTPMSYNFPIGTTMQKLVLMKRPYCQNICIENGDGAIIGSIDYSLTKAHGCDIRILRDAHRRPCAIIQRKRGRSIGSPGIFRVYGAKPAATGQRPTINDKVKWCYRWAEISITGSIGAKKLVMKRYPSASTSQYYSTKQLGSLLSKGKLKGFSFLDNDETECAMMTSLEHPHRAKAVVVAPGQDVCLMLAFCAVVDEVIYKD